MALHCSFCGKSQDQVEQMITGRNVCICDECVDECNKIIDGKEESEERYEGDVPSPREIYNELCRHVIGQDHAKKTLAIAVHSHHLQVTNPDASFRKSNVLIHGPTGCGKTLMAEALANYLGVPFAITDATTLTEAGYVGEDVENVLLRLIQAADYDIDEAERGIVYIDEIDKCAKSDGNRSITRDVSGEGVQQALLKILEGTDAAIPTQGGRKHPGQEMYRINTRNILFILGGAFVGLDEIVVRRSGQSGVGFGAELLNETRNSKELLAAVQPTDLHRFGLIPEFVGRVPVLTYVENLDEAALVRVLTEPKDSLISEYQGKFQLDNASLEFTEGALVEIAKKAIQLGSGARGLRSIVEGVLRDTFFDLPYLSPTVVKITAESVRGEGRPYISSPREAC